MSLNTTKKLNYISMFDGCLYTPQNSRNATLIVNMLAVNSDYIDMVKETLDDLPVGYSETLPAIYTKDGCSRKQQIRLQSRSHPELTKIKERLYLDGRKVIDPHMLTMLDAESLAIAFMADGSRTVDKRWKNSTPQYRLHTNNLSYGDNLLFKYAIKEKLELEFNIIRKGSRYDLRLLGNQSSKFEDTVGPYVLNSFNYKLGR